MITDIQMLINLCEQELNEREYTLSLHTQISKTWFALMNWMTEKEHHQFTMEVGYEYCDLHFGGHDLTNPIKRQYRKGLRAIRMLISYQKDGEFEFRTPSVVREFSGITGIHMENYLTHLESVIGLKQSSLSNKRFYLILLNDYLESNGYTYSNMSVQLVTGFYNSQSFTLASRHNCNSTLRLFLKYLFDSGLTHYDCSIYIMPDNYKQSKKLPTTYEEAEIKLIIQTVDRGAAIGKRDYLVILLAAEYGWRTSDIVHFSFSQIDWDKNVISFNQHKTNAPINYPLIASIGNAIIDYLENGRPITKTQEIIVSHETANKGKMLNRGTVHSIVSKYMKRANISHWKNKKHGAHSLRHSLATNLLKKNVSMPLISTVLGHQTTESTKIYLSVDFKQLRQCALPMPPVKSTYYLGDEPGE
ncbi:MAG: site-specific integrase [Thermotogota bacterium]|nr:site-specific integrase [Thermotogota bacterium]